jgi:hypothetical protein
LLRQEAIMTQSTPTVPAQGSPDDSHVEIARGDRREQTHYEDDPDQGVRISHTFRPDEPLPADEHTDRQVNDAPAAPVQDARVVRPGPSVWEARPAKDD